MFDIEKQFDQWLENGDPATKEVKDSGDGLYNAFNSYVDELMFFFWEQGYKWAMKEQESYKQQKRDGERSQNHERQKTFGKPALPGMVRQYRNRTAGELFDTITRTKG